MLAFRAEDSFELSRWLIMSLSVVAFFGYFLVLLLFSLVRHPMYYCGLLVVNSLICSFLCYCLLGFTWYSLLFCLVYIGGVYILFIFVSVYRPNSNYCVWLNFELVYVGLGILGLCIIGVCMGYEVLQLEFRAFLCTSKEGVFYVLVCLTLLFGFLKLRLIMRVKLNYYR